MLIAFSGKDYFDPVQLSEISCFSVVRVRFIIVIPTDFCCLHPDNESDPFLFPTKGAGPEITMRYQIHRNDDTFSPTPDLLSFRNY